MLVFGSFMVKNFTIIYLRGPYLAVWSHIFFFGLRVDPVVVIPLIKRVTPSVFER